MNYVIFTITITITFLLVQYRLAVIKIIIQILSKINGSPKLPTAILFYTELVTDRENIAEDMKKRITDGAKFMRRKAAQAHEAIRTLLECMIITCVGLNCNYFVCRCCCC